MRRKILKAIVLAAFFGVKSNRVQHILAFSSVRNIMLLRFAVGRVRIFYVFLKKILLGVGKSCGAAGQEEGEEKNNARVYSTAEPNVFLSGKKIVDIKKAVPIKEMLSQMRKTYVRLID